MPTGVWLMDSPIDSESGNGGTNQGMDFQADLR
jgi:hypothetical protein